MKTSSLALYVLFVCLTPIDTLLDFSFSVGPSELWESLTISIIQLHIPLVYDVQIISETTYISDEFLRTIPVPVQLLASDFQENSYVFLFAQNKPFVLTTLDSAADSTKSKFVIFVDCQGCLAVKWILEQCWKRKLLNVLVIPIENGPLQVYTYFPFRQDACFDPSPVLVDVYNRTFELSAQLFPNRKVWNLQGCTLNVSCFAFHGIYFDSTGDLDGQFSSVFKAVAHSMNFSYEFVNTEGKEFFGSVSGPKKTGMRADVFYERAHFGFIPYLSPMDPKYLDYDSLAMTTCVTWCLPAILEKKSIWWFVVGEFAPSVWLMTFLSALCIVATDFVAQKYDRRIVATDFVAQKYDRLDYRSRKNTMCMNIWAALLQVSGRFSRYSVIPLRTVWICWVMSSLVLSTAYLSTLKSFRTAPSVEYSVKNIDDFEKSGIQPWYLQGFAELVDDVSETYPVVARLKSKSYLYQPHQIGASLQMMLHKNISILISDNECGVVADMLYNKLEVYPLPDACLQVTSWHLFVLSKNSVFTEAIATLVSRLTQAGFVQKSLRSFRPKSLKTEIRGKQLTVSNMLPALSLLFSGLSLSLLVLAIEKVYPYVWQ